MGNYYYYTNRSFYCGTDYIYLDIFKFQNGGGAVFGCASVLPGVGPVIVVSVRGYGIRIRVPELFAILSRLPSTPNISEFLGRVPGLFVSVSAVFPCPDFGRGRGAGARCSLGASGNARSMERVRGAVPRPGTSDVASGGGCATVDGAEVEISCA